MNRSKHKPFIRQDKLVILWGQVKNYRHFHCNIFLGLPSAPVCLYLLPFWSHDWCLNFDRSASSVHQGQRKGSGPIFLARRRIRIRNSSGAFNTIPWQCTTAKKCIRVDRFKSGQANMTHEEGAGCPSNSTTDESSTCSNCCLHLYLPYS